MLPRLFVRCFLSFVLFSASSFSFSSVELTYITYPDGVGISGCLDSSCPSEIIVPEMIDSKEVTRIEEDAFCNYSNYDVNFSKPDSVILPNTIKHLGESAFCDLNSIVVPASVISIYDAFDEIANIYIIKPADQNLNVYDFPVGSNLFACDGIDSEGNPINCEEAYQDIDRNVLDDNSAEIFVDVNGHVKIPDSYSWFDEDAFFSSNVNSFTIPNSVVYIGEESFKGFVGDIYIIKPAQQNLNVFHFPTSANLFACDGHDTSGNLVNCEEAYPGVARNAIDQDLAIEFVDINGHIEIPNTYTMINESLPAFDGINSISIPNSIMHIGEDVLEKNTFDSLIIPSSVVSFTDDSYLDVVGDIYIIKPADQYVNPYHLPHNSNHFVCESVDGSGNPVGCGDLWQSTIIENTEFTYDIIENGIEITGCVATCPSELVIPDEIDGLTVTSIGYGAFEGRSLNSVTLPATLTNIDNDAFYYNNLTSINFPEELARIGSEAFSHNQFNTISIPSNISIIEEGAFAENPGENYENWNYIKIRNQILLLGCVDSCPSNLVIPESINGVQVAFIGKEAFSEDEIYTLSLPEGLIEIESEAFAENYLTEVIIPETVTNLATNAFKYNSGLQHEIFTYLKINNSALLIECTEPCPTDLIIPETIDGYSVTFIDDGAFENSGISSLSFPNTLKHIEEWGFADNLLTSITIPYSLIGLEGDTFYYNPLERVHFLGNRPEFDITNRDFQSSATLNLVTYCPNTTGWPGEPIEGITPQLDETCDSDNDGVINTDDAFPFDSSRNIDESSDNSNDQSEDQYAILDIDQNGSFDALTDGLILLRYAFGLRGDSLINGVIDTNANRTTAAEIEAYIQTLVP